VIFVVLQQLWEISDQHKPSVAVPGRLPSFAPSCDNLVTTPAPEWRAAGLCALFADKFDATRDASTYQRPQPPGRQLPLPMRRSNDCLAPTYSMRTSQPGCLLLFTPLAALRICWSAGWRRWPR